MSPAILCTVLAEHYGLRDCRVSGQRRGWSALAYRVDAPLEGFFLKVYRKSRVSTPRLTADALTDEARRTALGHLAAEGANLP